MSDRFRRSRRLALMVLAGLLVASGVQAQGYWRGRGGDYGEPPPRGREYRPPPRQFADPDRAAAKRAFDAMMGMRRIDIAGIEAARRAMPS